MLPTNPDVAAQTKVFCFFFSKKNCFLPGLCSKTPDSFGSAEMARYRGVRKNSGRINYRVTNVLQYEIHRRDAFVPGEREENFVSGDLLIAPPMLSQPIVSARNTGTGAPAAASAKFETLPSQSQGTTNLNPGFRLDPALNLAVLQFFDEKGDVTQTIPSQKQLQAYQQDFGVAARDTQGSALDPLGPES
jgi:hypothetical protein